jgi:hypothetical protein
VAPSGAKTYSRLDRSGRTLRRGVCVSIIMLLSIACGRKPGCGDGVTVCKPRPLTHPQGTGLRGVTESILPFVWHSPTVVHSQPVALSFLVVRPPVMLATVIALAK